MHKSKKRWLIYGVLMSVVAVVVVQFLWGYYIGRRTGRELVEERFRTERPDAMATEDAIQISAAGAGKSPQAVSKSTPDASNRIRRITFNDIDLTRLLKVKELSPEHVEQIPNAVTELDGKFVTVEGFMYPAFQDTGLTQFILVEQLQL